jgi:hypothetical protein
MWGRRRACRIWSPVLGKALGAMALCAATVVSVGLVPSGTAGASPPTLQFLLSGNVGGGASTTLSGTAYLDAGVSDTSQVQKVWFETVPTQPFCPPPAANPCPNTVVAQGTLTLYGWLAEWNTNTLSWPNGQYALFVVAQDNASTTTYTIGSPITITLDNPPPTTSVLVPSPGATLSGTKQLLDASANCGASSIISFRVTGPEPADTYQGQQTGVSTVDSIYGFYGYWNTTEVPNGTYALSSDADCFTGGGIGFSSPITVSVYNPPPTTSVLIPSNGATQSGTGALLDASASAGVDYVQFELSGGTLHDDVIATATPTIYGWLAQWNTTTIPDGHYTLQSVAYYPPPGIVSTTSTGITISIGN